MRSTSSLTPRSRRARRRRFRRLRLSRVHRATRSRSTRRPRSPSRWCPARRRSPSRTASGTTVPGSASFNSADTVDTFTPTSALAAGATYTVTVSGATDQFGQMMTTDTYTFITSKAFDVGGQCPCAIWPDAAPSGATDATDTSRWSSASSSRPASSGTVSGVRFYKEPDNTGSPHRHPVDRQRHPAGHRHVQQRVHPGLGGAGLHHPGGGHGRHDLCGVVPCTAGHYADTSGGLSSAVTNGPLTALANGGVYAYGSTTTFPSSSYAGSNYWVDVDYTAHLPSRRRFRRRRLSRVHRATRSRLTRQSRSPSRWCPARRRSPLRTAAGPLCPAARRSTVRTRSTPSRPPARWRRAPPIPSRSAEPRTAPARR